jgi:hypothetical protein
MIHKLFATRHPHRLAGKFQCWPSLLLVILLVFGWKSALAQSSAGSLNCGAPRGGINPSTGSTPATTKNNSKVDKFNAIQQQGVKNQQAIQQAGGNILNLLQMLHTSKPDTQLDPDDTPAPDPAAAAAAQQQIINAEAADLLSSANSLLPSQPSAGPSTQPNSNAAVSALLDENTPSNAATAAVNSLLGGAAPQDTGATSTATAVAGLLDNGTQPADANSVPPPPAVNVPQDPNAQQPGDPFYQPPMPDKSQWYTPPTPLQDSAMNADLQDSVDQPNPSMFNTLRQQLQSGVQTVRQEVRDELNSLVASGKSLIAPYVNDPGLQAVYHVISNGPTMPVTQPTDSGDTMVNNVAGSALLTSVPILKVTTTTPVQMLTNPVGTYKNISAPADQMNSQAAGVLGFAQSNLPTLNPVGQQ